ncbi:MAG: UPF0236 family protein [Prevotellaceae bacterium]|jgi:hypothetical protein|nr:UPF0236 family protein [Prevotellaceae bacterium]
MTKEEYLAIAASHYEEIESLKEKDNFYDYEKSFDQVWQELGRLYLENHMNELSSTRDRRKKTLTKFGEITVSKSHPYMQGVVNGFSISPLMQELITYAGHLECYAKSEEILEKFTQVKVSPSQVYRVTDCVGESLEEEEKQAERILPPLSKEDVLYVELDGSMLCTREEEAWKEVKLGRLFKGSDCLNPNSNSAYLSDSQYVAHLGSSNDFGERLQKIVDSYGRLYHRLVFITDGAAWIQRMDCRPLPAQLSGT